MSKVELSEDDAHSRVGILFKLPPSDDHDMTFVAVSVKWLLQHGVPLDPETGKALEYSSTHIIQ
jgi:hypothetical protein